MTTPRLLPTEQRLIDALAARRLTLAEPLRRPLVNSLAAELGWTAAEVQSERNRARKALGYVAPPPRAEHELTARQERLVDALEALGYAVTQRIPGEVLETLAEQVGGTPVAMQRLVMAVRTRWGVRIQGGLTPQPEHLQTGLLAEAPTLPLECHDPAVVAWCQREGLRLAETARPRWRGW